MENALFESVPDRCANPEVLYSNVADDNIEVEGVANARWTYRRCAEDGSIWLSPRLRASENWRVYAGYRTHKASPLATAGSWTRQESERALKAWALGCRRVVGRASHSPL
jgi:hypothetical protein